MVNKLKILAALLMLGLTCAWPSSGTYLTGYQGPCDIVTCAEAYSVTRAMKLSYTGALFQLYNGSSSLDIGQINHAADMTTWSSFCSGVPSNCVIAKIYGQINGNTLVPSTVDSDSGTTPGHCSGGTNYKCAAKFAIESSTGLPIINTLNPPLTGDPQPEYYNGNGTLGATDTASTGINAGDNAMSVMYNGKNVASPFCCGLFMLAHVYNSACCSTATSGTDYGIAIRYGTSGVAGPCTTTTTYCLIVDWECCGTGGDPAPDQADYGSTPESVTAVITFDPVSNTSKGFINNNTSLWSHSPPGIHTGNTPAAGKFIHVGGGGDLSQPAPMRMREGIFANSALNSSQITALNTNINNFYNVTSKYYGIGDVASGATFYGGLRPYSAATVGNVAVNVKRSSDSHTCDIVTAASGLGSSGLGNTVNCSTGADNAQLGSAFCNATTCSITELYDQTGNGNHLIQATSAHQPTLTFNCIGSLPCMAFSGSQNVQSTTCPVTVAPAVMGTMAIVTGNLATDQVLYSPCVHAGVAGTSVLYHLNTGVPSVSCQALGDFQSVAEPNNTWHAGQCYIPTSGNGDLVVDGVDLNASVGTGFYTGNGAGLGGFGEDNGEYLTGNITEAYLYASHLSVATMQSICQNQGLYYAVPAC